MAIGYIGGKSCQTEFLYSHCPKKDDYTTLVLNFSGVGWLFLKEDFSHCERIVFNDINPYLINLLKAFTEQQRFLQEFSYYMQPGKELSLDPAETIEQTRLRLSRLFDKWRQELFRTSINLDVIDYRAAVMFAFLQTHSFSSRHPLRSGFTTKSKNPLLPNFLRVVNKLRNNEYTGLLKRVTFENLDFEECFRKYDTEKTFFMLTRPTGSVSRIIMLTMTNSDYTAIFASLER